jgi:hypothetical protein
MPYKSKQAWEEAMIKKYGSLEAALQFMSTIGKSGGKTLTDKKKGFAADPKKAALAGQKSRLRRNRI